MTDCEWIGTDCDFSLVRGGGFDFSVKVYPGGGNYDVKSSCMYWGVI